MDTEVDPTAKALARDETVDTVVVGSGIAGLATAYELAEQGHSVAVLDRGAIAGGMTARTTAHLTSPSDDGFTSLTKVRGEDLARMFYQSHSAAIDRIEAIVEKERIDCTFRRLDGFLFPALGTKASDELTPEFEAAKKAGVAVEWHKGIPFRGLSEVRCLRYANQGTFHPLRYLRGIVGALKKRGVKLFSETPVVEVAENSDGISVRTENGRTVKARFAVIATNSPINDRVAIHSKQAPYRTYAMALTMAKGALKDGLYWDTADPYHYVRPQPGNSVDYLIAGGADHKTGEADDGEVRFEAVEAWIRNLLPDLGKVSYSWSGQVMDPVDYSAFIGRNPDNENVFVITGDSGQGITHGVVGSMVVRDLILQGESPWTELYEPSRKTPSSIANYIAENVTPLVNFAEYAEPGEISSTEDLKPGKGGILRQGSKKIAAYRAANGRVTLRSAVCTHLGCIVHWNSTEACWDCPCHGSHFAPDGSVLNGPATSPLAQVDDD